MQCPMSVRYNSFFWLLLLSSTVVRAQLVDAYTLSTHQEDSIFCSTLEADLWEAGFPDATCSLEKDHLKVSYTRSKFRLGARATHRLLSKIDTLPYDQVRSISITITDRGIPFYTYFIPVELGVPKPEHARFEIGINPFSDNLASAARGKGDDFTLLFSLDPQFRFSFGAAPDPFQVQFNLLPRLDLRLWKGSLLRFQYILPIYNELDIPEENICRPGLITLSQYLRLGRGLFSNISIGYFYPYRYGVQAQFCKFLLKDRAFIGAQFGYTGYASYPKRLFIDEPVPGWQVSSIEYADYLLTAGWRWNSQNLQLIAGWGKALFQQEVKSLVISRQFDLTTIELFAQQLDTNWNYGVRLQVPLPFVRHFIGKRLAVQTAPFIDYYYNGTQNYYQDYSTGQRFPFLSDQLHPDLIHSAYLGK